MDTPRPPPGPKGLFLIEADLRSYGWTWVAKWEIDYSLGVLLKAHADFEDYLLLNEKMPERGEH